jgi:hypothetical protein
MHQALKDVDKLNYGDTNSKDFDAQQSTNFLIAKHIVNKALEEIK